MRRDLPEASDSSILLSRILSVLERIDGRLAKAASVRVLDPLALAIRAFLGAGIAFSASELIAHADAELLEAIGGADPGALGRRLARLEGRGVVRLGKDENGVIWCVADDS